MRSIIRIIVSVLMLVCAATAYAAEDDAIQASPHGCITSRSSAAEKIAAGERVAASLFAQLPGGPDVPEVPAPTFAPEMSQLSMENIYSGLWSRCGLSRRDRSLVTLGVLIALRAGDQLRFHFPIALRNGLQLSELEEVIYQASGYAGFPAAVSARLVAEEVLKVK